MSTVEGTSCQECKTGRYRKSERDSTWENTVYRCNNCDDKVVRPTVAKDLADAAKTTTAVVSIGTAVVAGLVWVADQLNNNKGGTK